MAALDPLVVDASGGLPTYSGLEFRMGLGGLGAFQEGIIDAGDFAATAQGAGLDISVAAGLVLVEDDGSGFRRNRALLPNDGAVLASAMTRLNPDGTDAGATGIAPNAGANPRWDQIVAQFRESSRDWRLCVLTGTATAGAAMGVAAGASSNNSGIATLSASCARLHAFLVPANNVQPLPQANIGNPRDPRAGDDFVAGAPPQYALGRPRAYVPRVLAYRGSASSIGTGGSPTPIPLDSEREDTDNMHNVSADTTRLTVKTPGVYDLKAGLAFVANATGQRMGAIRRNGGNDVRRFQLGTPGGTTLVLSLAASRRLAYGDYVEVTAYQESGAALDVLALAESSPEFEATWVAP